MSQHFSFVHLMLGPFAAQSSRYTSVFWIFFFKGLLSFSVNHESGKRAVVNDCDAIQPFLLGYSRTKHLQIGVPVMYSEIHFALRCEYKFN